MKNRLSLLTLLITLVYGTTFANVLSWRSYTNMYNIRDMVLRGEEIWCATNGGVFSFNTTDKSFRLFSNIDGLSALDVRTIEVDSDGDIWIGTATGLINLLHFPKMDFELIDDYKRHVINDIAVLNKDSMLIAFDNGIGLYVKPDREVKENYYSLGKEFESRIQVNSLFIDGKEIWAATNVGIAKTSLDKINLNDPESWTNYTTKNGLPGKAVKAIQVAKNVAYAITDKGVARFDTTQWTSINNGGFSEIPDYLYSFFEKSDTLYMATAYGVYRYEPARNYWFLHSKKILSYAKRVLIDELNRTWIGRLIPEEKDEEGLGGLATYTYSDSVWTVYFPPGPASNNLVDIAIDQNGTWWFASHDKGLLSYNGIEWKKYGIRQGLPSNKYLAVAVDQNNNIWGGSEGAGLVRISSDGKITKFPGRLSGSSATYILVTDIDVDSKNNIWLIDHLAANNNILVCVTPDSNWYYFSKVITNNVTRLEIDKVDRVWVSSKDRGLFVLDHNNTLEDKSDDDFDQGFESKEGGLYSNTVTDIKEDQEGVMWIGTDQGLNYWDPYSGKTQAVDSFYYQIISPNIQAIEVDAQNNIWVGTSAGISQIPSFDRAKPVNFYMQNSPLVNDVISALRINPKTGELLIATPSGLSVLETGLTEASGSDYRYFQVYPNPFMIGKGSDELFISNLAENSKSVKIHTINGALVREIPLDNPVRGGFGGQAIWNGKNDQGELVASGVYLIFVYTESGTKHLSKVAVIRE